jgi:predicted AlkP superfamily pyrophosphatase or phosphodiesterase
MVVISFDGLSTLDFDYIAKLPNFKKFLSGAAYCKKVYSVYPSVTYPAHATIVTGKYPKNHGVVNNTLFQPNRKKPDWYWQRKYVKGETLYDAVIKQGKKVAALLWPVTGKSKIQYNLPEIFANRPWKNQVMVSLMNGSPLYQIDLNNKFGHLRKGLKQPYLDNFVHASALYTLENKKPDLTLIHYVDLDSMRHYHGFNSKEAKDALERHDKRLGEIIECLKKNNMYDESTIIVLGDHSSLDEDKIIRINALLKEKGYIDVDANGKIIAYRAISKNCDGSAYIYTKEGKCDIKELRKLLDSFNDKYKCLEAIYTKAEAEKFGADSNCSFMLEANKGYYFVDDYEGELTEEVKPEEVGTLPHRTKATHGYSPYKKDYTTVFMAKGQSINEGAVIESMSLIDEAPTMAKLLGVELPGVDGKVIEELLKFS